jgi:PAS domain S-box-containing protein
MIGAPVEQLELATVIKVSQAVSSEIVREKLIDTIMRTAIEHAGAGRGVLVIPSEAEQRIEAEAVVSGGSIIVQRGGGSPTVTPALPNSIVNYVIRTGESVILADTSVQSLFYGDPYIKDRPAGSVLCLPLINQAKLIGALYLENNLAAHVFTPARITVLKLLASQAAISLENNRAEHELRTSREDLRRSEAYLAQAQRVSQSGAFAFNADKSLYWSEGLYRIWGFDPQQPIPEREIWRQRVHPDDRNRIYEELQDALREKRDYTIEHRIVLADGTLKHLRSIGHPSFTATGELVEVVGTTIDVTERKRAEEERERLRQLEADLAHLNRLGVMGELTASLAHEILHPIATARNNARAGMRFLELAPPNLGEVMEALACVVRDADRAKDIVGRIRDHIKKAPPRKELFELNGAIDEVIVMVRNAIDRSRVAVRTHLKDGIIIVRGDRVQLQQVVLNLILNAVEAMSMVGDGPRELSISTERYETSGFLVAVRDSGPGIDPEHRELVFKPFHTTKPSGMGMGLSICRSIIDSHGGRLWVDANEPQGAAFQFTLPAADENS